MQETQDTTSGTATPHAGETAAGVLQLLLGWGAKSEQAISYCQHAHLTVYK
jgi:hypothetical protein